MPRYFFPAEVEPFAEAVSDRIFWFRPTSVIAGRVLSTGSYLTVKDSDGGRSSADDFWDMAGDLTWDLSRMGEVRRGPPLDRRLEDAG